MSNYDDDLKKAINDVTDELCKMPRKEFYMMLDEHSKTDRAKAIRYWLNHEDIDEENVNEQDESSNSGVRDKGSCCMEGWSIGIFY